jgi:hypothetical protein
MRHGQQTNQQIKLPVIVDFTVLINITEEVRSFFIWIQKTFICLAGFSQTNPFSPQEQAI